MSKVEFLVVVAVHVGGISTGTLLALYYPDSESYLYVGLLTVASLLVIAFFVGRRKKAT